MPETAPLDSGTERQGPEEPWSGNEPATEGAAFVSSRRALGELRDALQKFGRSLREEVPVAARQMTNKLRTLAGAGWLRFRRTKFSWTKLSVAELAARSGTLRRLATLRSEGTKGAYATPVSQRGRRAILARCAAVAAAAFLVFVVVLFAWALRDVPWDEIADGSLKPVVVLETSDGKPLVSQGPIQGPYAAREDFPPHLIDAVLTREDRRFYEHFGIDLKGIFRAVYRNVGAGEVVQGGSTITQQLIKILYLERERTWKRKIQEAVIAFWLERKLGKDEILTRYLNNIYLGAGATGVPAAARIYFNKEVGELNIGEAATLAGIIRAPSQLNPLSNPEAARRQAELVLDAMIKGGKITAEQAKTATAGFAELRPAKPATRSGSWFADWVMQEARELAGPYRGTIKVKTTMVPQLQAIAEKVVAQSLQREGGKANASQAALVAMTPQGAVVAMVGGRDYSRSTFNRAVTAMRQPGSAFKLFVYYAALKAGLTPFDLVEDAPIEINGWLPENYGGGYRGHVSIAEAFARSLNAATVALAMEVGIDKVVAAARELGVDAKLSETPSLALGSSEVNLLDLTGAYASVRAGVAPIEPWGIASFHAEDQPRAFRVGPPKQPTTDLSPYQPDLIGLLRLVVERGTGREADLGALSAGKTGTSQNHRDAWFVGFTERLIVGVWVGNDDETPMNEVTGGKLPARIWRNFMTAALAAGDGGAASEPDAVAGDSSAPDSEASASCNFRACARAYRSFRPSDCTFQPYSGPRRLCER
ncbi:PBP1A family penicillin-binding protein [Sinorhizobium numidicum]|uniref:Lectin-like protein BA14k n=1 Tax=Sinorhizobium numidicum TaxID=680248 RepID=A0ABY8CMP6_9HYPH|nr:PBP1A family penicillin-binding protein [Sinorhizobium numidicum]WEX73941.1 PBP1A family penicillin-binding protein [Sinorhizobium numidicum]WEX79926.1 PBP1A family penicillin-binding protein [Sinorhizobium numidicum]